MSRLNGHATRRRTGSPSCPPWCAWPIEHSGNHVRLLHTLALPPASPASALAVTLEGQLPEPLVGISLANHQGGIIAGGLLTWGHVIMMTAVMADAAERWAP